MRFFPKQPWATIKLEVPCGRVRRNWMNGHDGAWPSSHQCRIRPRQSVALQSLMPNSATTERGPPVTNGEFGHDGAWPLYVLSIAIAKGSNLMEGRAAVASASARETATTERGPPVTNGEFGHDRAWPSSHQCRIRPRRSVALQLARKQANIIVQVAPRATTACYCLRLFSPRATPQIAAFGCCVVGFGSHCGVILSVLRGAN